LSDIRAAPLPPASRREVVAWAMFDFANSSYTTIVVTFFFSLVFTKLIASGPSADLWWGRAITISNVTVLLLSPLMGAIADESGRKKAFLFATYLLCVTSTAALWFVQPGQVPLAIALFVLSNVAFSFGENFAAAFLPEISTPATIGRISGFGWGLGYFGGLLALACAFPLAKAGIEMANYERLRLIWPMTGMFFLLAGIPTFLFLKERAPKRSEPFAYYLKNGFGRVATTIRSARDFRELARFLLVFYVYSIGLTSTIAFFGVYAGTTLEFTVLELFALGALLQIPSALGAIAFGLVQDKLGAQRTLQIALALWLFVSATVALATEKSTFWAIAMVAGLGIGSVQASSRALVGAFSPVEKSGEFFGLWGLAGKAAYACGPLIFGFVSALSGSQRAAVWVNGAFFLIGLVAMFAVDERRGRATAAAWRAPATS
jgi:UMF1 family MFS transporter